MLVLYIKCTVNVLIDTADKRTNMYIDCSPLTLTLHSVTRYLMISNCPSQTASPNMVSPDFVTGAVVSGNTNKMTSQLQLLCNCLWLGQHATEHVRQIGRSLWQSRAKLTGYPGLWGGK